MDFSARLNRSGRGGVKDAPAEPWRRFLPRLAVILLLLGLAASRTVPAVAQTPASATVTSPDGLNLRASAGQQGQIVSVIPSGATVTITGSPTSDGWYPVSYAGVSGWVDGAYLAFPSSGTAAPASTAIAAVPPSGATGAAGTAGTTMVVSTDGLNLRSAPNTSSTVLTTVPRGTVVQVTGAASGNWLPVSVGGASGWMDSDYLAPSGSAASAPAAASPAVLLSQPASSGSSSAAAPTGAAATPSSAGATVPVSLSLTATNGQPIAGISFTLTGQQGGPSQTQVTDQAGSASFALVPPGIYSLSQDTSPNASFSSMTINGASASPGELFELQPGGTYVITVVDTTAAASSPSAQGIPPVLPPRSSPTTADSPAP